MGSREPMQASRAQATSLSNAASRSFDSRGPSEARPAYGLRHARQRGRVGAGTTFRENRVIAAMTVQIALDALFLDVAQFTVCRQLPVTANHAPAGERSKPKEPNQTHMATLSSRGGTLEQAICRSAAASCRTQRTKGSLFLRDFLPARVRTARPAGGTGPGDHWIRFNGLERPAAGPCLPRAPS